MPFINDERYRLFSDWLDGLAQEIPGNEDTAAFNFNIYEYRYDEGRMYDIQLIASDYFEEDDPDWACSESYSSAENVCCIPRTEDIKDWEQGLELASELVKRYLEEGSLADRLKSSQAVGVGFVDGDIEIVYKKEA